MIITQLKKKKTSSYLSPLFIFLYDDVVALLFLVPIQKSTQPAEIRLRDLTRTSIASSSLHHPAGRVFGDSTRFAHDAKNATQKASSPLKTQQNNIIIPPSPSTRCNPISVSSNKDKDKLIDGPANDRAGLNRLARPSVETAGF